MYEQITIGLSRPSEPTPHPHEKGSKDGLDCNLTPQEARKAEGGRGPGRVGLPSPLGLEGVVAEDSSAFSLYHSTFGGSGGEGSPLGVATF